MSDSGWTCSDCGRCVFVARVWDDRVVCPDCSDVFKTNLRVLKHEAETPMRDHDEDGRCCWLARHGLTP